MRIRNSFVLLAGLLLWAGAAQAQTVRYELVATKGDINLSGKKSVDFALMLNGGIPAPTLEFTEGDDAEIVVKNQIPDDELSIHWHGILLPNEMDGVPYVNTPPIKSGESFTFKFKIRQNGTYWYHSHTNVQEQKGIYGAIVIHPRERKIDYDQDVVVVLSDWSDENAVDILRNLRKDGDYYLYKKGTMRSLLGAIQAGGLGTYLHNEWTRMGGMDYSDVGYDAFLTNGKRSTQLLDARAGQKVRVRLINASASTYFYVSLGQAPMKVISADGIDIQPVLAKELLIGMAETYDLLFEVPEDKNYELRATAQDGTGLTSGWIGSGEKVAAPDRPAPDLYAPMDHGGGEHGRHGSHGNHGHSGHGSHHAGALKKVDSLTVDDVQAQRPTKFSEEVRRAHDVKLVLGGDMSRYIWFINGKTIAQDRTLLINEGDVIRFTFENTTMMHHPMHLHGHFFRVINRFGDSSPLKHTVDVPPHSTRTIEFYADEPGEWMLHCHNLFHLKTGMARVVKYSSFTPSKTIAHWQKHDPHLHDHWYFYGMAEVATNHAQSMLRLSQTWNQFDARVETRNTTGKNFSFGEPWEVEGDLFYRRWLDQNLNLVFGGTLFDKTTSAIVGVAYRLPMLIYTDLMVTHRGKFRLDVEKRFQWTRTIFTDVDFTWRPGQVTEDISEAAEFEISLMYSPVWAWAAGLMFTNDSVGGGVQFQF